MCALSIGDLSRLARTPVATIRYYETRGLLPEPGRTGGGQRRFGAADVVRLDFIRTRRELGFSIPDILVLLAQSGPDAAPCLAARKSAEEQLDRVRDQIANLRRVEAALVAQIAGCGPACQGPDPADCLLVPPPRRILNVRT